MAYIDDVRSQNLSGRSLYSVVATFPIACFILTFLTDLAYWATASFIWETMSVWLLTIGLFGAAVAALAGCVDLARSRRGARHGRSWWSVLGHVVAVGLSLVNVLVHSRDGYTAVVPQGLVLSAGTVLVLLVTTVWARPRRATTRAGGVA